MQSSIALFYLNLQKHPKYEGTTVVVLRISIYQFNLGVFSSGDGRQARVNWKVVSVFQIKPSCIRRKQYSPRQGNTLFLSRIQLRSYDMNVWEATRALATKNPQESNVAYSGGAGERAWTGRVTCICDLFPSVHNRPRQETFGAERSLKNIHKAQDNNHFPSLKMTVMNIGFHKALEIPWPVSPLSAFHALFSKDFAIHIIFEDMLKTSRKKLSRCQILHEVTYQRCLQTRSTRYC